VHESAAGTNQVDLSYAQSNHSYGQQKKQTQSSFGQASGVAPGTAARIYPNQVKYI